MKYENQTTLDYLIECGISYCCEYEGEYIVDVKTNDHDTLVWVVDKKTRIAKPTYVMDVLDIINEPNVKKLKDYSELKKAV